MKKIDIFSKEVKSIGMSDKGGMYGFPIIVTNYDVEKGEVHGERLDDGQKVIVTLTERDDSASGKKARPTVAQFASYDARGSDRATCATVPNEGIMFLDAPRKLGVDGAGTENEVTRFSANWLTSLVHHAEEAFAIPEVMMSVRGGTGPKGPYALVNILPTMNMIDDDYAVLGMDKPALATDAADLEARITKALKSGGSAGIRVIQGEDADAVVVMGGRNVKAEEMAKKYADEIAPLFDDATCKIEVIQVSTLFVGTDTLASARMQRGLEFFKLADGEKKNPAFANGTIALMQHKDGGLFVSFAQRTSNFTAKNLTDAVLYAQTENLQPQFPDLRQQEPDAQPEDNLDLDNHGASFSGEPKQTESPEPKSKAQETESSAPAARTRSRPRPS